MTSLERRAVSDRPAKWDAGAAAIAADSETTTPWPDDSTRLAPDQRRREIARILARGILRPGRPAVTPFDSTDSATIGSDESCLEPSAKFRPHVTGG